MKKLVLLCLLFVLFPSSAFALNADEFDNDWEEYVGILQPDRQWFDYLPEHEEQGASKEKPDGTKAYIQTGACESFAMLNALEIMMKRQFGSYKDQIIEAMLGFKPLSYPSEINFADRYTTVMSGTNPEYGNTYKKVAVSIETDGLLLEHTFPNFDNIWSNEDYYQAISWQMQARAKNIFSILTPYSQQVATGYAKPEAIWNALQYAPVRVTILQGGPKINNIHQKFTPPPDKIWGHALVIVGGVEGEYFVAIDHGSEQFKYFAWDFNFISPTVSWWMEP